MARPGRRERRVPVASLVTRQVPNDQGTSERPGMPGREEASVYRYTSTL